MAVKAAAKQLEGFIETFLPDFALLDGGYLVGGEFQTFAQTKFGDDVELDGEGEFAVEVNPPAIGPSFGFDDLCDHRHIAHCMVRFSTPRYHMLPFCRYIK